MALKPEQAGKAHTLRIGKGQQSPSLSNILKHLRDSNQDNYRDGTRCVSWSFGERYERGAVVSWNNAEYAALTDIERSVVMPDYERNQWMRLAEADSQGQREKPDAAADGFSKPKDKGRRQGGHADKDGQDWVTVSGEIKEWVNGGFYGQFQVVRYMGYAYRALRNIPHWYGLTPPKSEWWEKIGRIR